MIPVKLTISGFLSYQEPTEIDFSGIRVACITGRNGAGKSAMLDAITWALFGEARKSDDSIINDLVPDRTAKVDFEFRYEDAEYLVRRQKSANKPTTADFFIRSEDGKSWKALTEKKLTDTNRRICKTLHMDYKTFINVSFFLQGKADQFTGQNASERKKVLSNILDLDVWEVYKAKAAEYRKQAEIEVRQLEHYIQENEEELKEEASRKQRLAEILAQIQEAEKSVADADQQWNMAKATEASILSIKNMLTQKQQDEDRQARQIRMQQVTLQSRMKEQEELKSRLSCADNIEKNYAMLLDIRQKLEEMNAAGLEFSRLENRKNSLQNTIQSTEKQLRYEQTQLLHEKAEIEKLLPERDRFISENKQNNVILLQLTDELSQREPLKQLQESITEQGTELKSKCITLESKSKEISEKIENLLKNRGGICPTCGREMDEAHCRSHAAELNLQLTNINTERAQRNNEYAEARRQYSELNRQIKHFDEVQQRIADLKIQIAGNEHKITDITSRLKNWEEKEKRLQEIERSLTAADFCTGERSALQALMQQISALAYNRETHQDLQAQYSRLSGAEKEHQALISDQSRILPLEREIDEKRSLLTDEISHLELLRKEREETQQKYSELMQQMPDIQAIEKFRIESIRTLNRLSQEKGQAEQQVRHLEDARSNLKHYGDEFKEKRELIERCKTLEKAFGKDGIPALLIEQAVPEIEEQANNLLQQLSDGAMTLRLSTQGTYKSKKEEVKETLDILISDPYGVREYEMFSGGEAFRINFSLRLALSKILAQRAGSRLQTLVIDEGFGSQDEEGRARLAEAITAVQNDFEKILVITHLSELKEAFPSRIEVEKTANGSHAEVIL